MHGFCEAESLVEGRRRKRKAVVGLIGRSCLASALLDSLRFPSAAIDGSRGSVPPDGLKRIGQRPDSGGQPSWALRSGGQLVFCRRRKERGAGNSVGRNRNLCLGCPFDFLAADVRRRGRAKTLLVGEPLRSATGDGSGLRRQSTLALSHPLGLSSDGSGRSLWLLYHPILRFLLQTTRQLFGRS